MTSRVSAAIDAAHAEGRGAFVGYLPAGFPDVATSIEAAVALAEAGADVIELGPPYSDPVMDGLVIQEATQTALANGFRMADLFTIIREVTARTEGGSAPQACRSLVLPPPRAARQRTNRRAERTATARQAELSANYRP